MSEPKPLRIKRLHGLFHARFNAGGHEAVLSSVVRLIRETKYDPNNLYLALYACLFSQFPHPRAPKPEYLTLLVTGLREALPSCPPERSKLVTDMLPSLGGTLSAGIVQEGMARAGVVARILGSVFEVVSMPEEQLAALEGMEVAPVENRVLH